MSYASLRAQASDLLLAISRQNQILHDLEKQLEIVRQQLSAIVYPVLTLAPELTSEIFIRCLPISREWDDDVVNPKEAPLLLTHVCSAWRAIAISTPALWSTLDIEVVGRMSVVHFSDIVKAWLRRAGQLPLSVKIRGPVLETNKFHQFVETFRRYAARMQSLQLHLNIEDYQRMDMGPLQFSALRSLSVRLLALNEEDLEDCGQTMLFHDVPVLQELLMSKALPSFLIFPWEQLTKFTGDLYTIAGCLEALRAMPNLVECRFSTYSSTQRVSDVVPEHVSHSKLQSLTLFASSAQHWDEASSIEMLGFITLPGLQALEILYPDPETFADDIFDEFLVRSESSLRRLVIRGDMDLQALSLLRVSALTELEISHPGVGFVRAFFHYLSEHIAFVPSLQTLSFLGCREGGGEASVHDILHFAAAPILARNKPRDGVALLQSFRVVSAPVYPASFPANDSRLIPFKDLKTQGMNVYIGTEMESFV